MQKGSNTSTNSSLVTAVVLNTTILLLFFKSFCLLSNNVVVMIESAIRLVLAVHTFTLSAHVSPFFPLYGTIQQSWCCESINDLHPSSIAFCGHAVAFFNFIYCSHFFSHNNFIFSNAYFLCYSLQNLCAPNKTYLNILL